MPKMPLQRDDKTTILAHINDLFRMTYSELMGDVVITESVLALDEKPLTAVMQAVMDTKSFEDAEHSMGIVRVSIGSRRREFNWRIIYYDGRDKRWGSEDPLDLSKTWRVITVMTPEEW